MPHPYGDVETRLGKAVEPYMNMFGRDPHTLFVHLLADVILACELRNYEIAALAVEAREMLVQDGELRPDRQPFGG